MDTTLGINLNDITVFNDIRIRLAAVTPEMLMATERRMQTSKSKVVGRVDNLATRALFALSMNLHAESVIAAAQASACSSDTEEKEFTERAIILEVLSDVCRELFWAQAKQDIGLYENENIAVKKGWVLVREKSNPGPAELLGILRGQLGGE